MAFRIPGTKLTARLFDRVETADSQYGIYDIGIQHEDGGLDVVSFGGSAYTAKKVIENLNTKADKAAPEAA